MSDDPASGSTPALTASLRAVHQLVEAVRNQVGPVGDARRAPVDAVLTRMTGPVRVKVVGQVSAGKSTLVNALVGRRIAATAAQDCTKIATSYVYGAPDRTVALLADGRERRAGFGFDERDELVDDDVAQLRVYLASGLLRDFTLIDTPGLHPTQTQPGTRDGSELEADVLVYAFRGALREADAAVVADFVEATGGQTPQSAACVGLLTHADNFGDGPWGPQDPMELARRAATRLQQALPGQFSAILPVCGLMAETVRTGALTEDDARVLASVRDLDPTSLQYLDQLPLPAGVVREDVRRVRSRVGSYGLRYGTSSSASAATLIAWMLRQSGLLAVEEHLGRGLIPVVQIGRAERAISDLLRMVGRSDLDPKVGALVEHRLNGPEFQPLREYRVYRKLAQQAPESPLLPDLAGLMAGTAVRGTESAADLLGQATAYHGRAVMARRRVEAEAAETISRSLVLRAQQADRRRTTGRRP